MSDPIIPTPEQLAENRRAHWHQNGDALLTAEAVLPWIARTGLLLFAPRGQQFPAPAPTLVEATLGAPNPTPSLADRETARSLLGRLVAQGDVLPLNLLGAPGTTADEPDFLVSAAIFPYLFTLRGDKGWKQLPSSAGAFKVSPLAVNTYALLSESGPRSAADLANELGKGLTEAAVLRALSELWQHLRVFPVAQSDGVTLWELATARFTKALKSGSNAGQPTALSALITLYLGQAVLATEDEIEVFLSPLAPRSRVRDVLHALTAARELESLVVEGKHCLYIHGDAPAFAPPAEADSEASADTAEAGLTLEGEGRIKKFGTGARKPPFGKAKPFAAGNRERRPFDRARGPVRQPAASREAGKPAFNRPWDEDRTARTARAASAPADGAAEPEFQDVDLDAAGGATEAQRPPRPAFDRPKKTFGKPAFGDRKKSFGDRKPFGDRGKPSFGDRPRPSFGDRPRSDRPSFGDRDRSGPGKPSFGDRPRSDRPSFGDRDKRGPGKPPFGDRQRPSFGDRPRPGGGDRPAFSRNRDDASGSENRPARPFRPARPESAGEGRAPFQRPSRPGFDRASGGGGRPPFRPAGDRPFRPRPDADGESRPPRRDFTGKPFDRKPRPDGAGRPDRPSRPDRPFRPRTEGAEPGRPPFKRFDARPAKPGGFSARPAPGGKRPFTKPGGKPTPGGKPGGPFDKFKDGNKPWGKRPPARKIRPEEDKG